MRFLFFLGWVLIILALVAAAAESFVRFFPGGSVILTPAYDLWYTLSPSTLTVLQIRLEKTLPFLWDPVLLAVLAVPAWLLLGGPGVVLAWYCRPGRVLTPQEIEDFEKHKDSLFLYDELAREAHDTGMDDGPDDQEPDHAGHEALEAAETVPVPTDDEMVAMIETEDGPTTESDPAKPGPR